jgi:hypothetical protein
MDDSIDEKVSSVTWKVTADDHDWAAKEQKRLKRWGMHAVPPTLNSPQRNFSPAQSRMLKSLARRSQLLSRAREKLERLEREWAEDRDILLAELATRG